MPFGSVVHAAVVAVECALVAVDGHPKVHDFAAPHFLCGTVYGLRRVVYFVGEWIRSISDRLVEFGCAIVLGELVA